MNDQIFAEGGCQCGAVTYQISNKPVMMVQCHCKNCQKASGTGHMSNAFFREKDVLTLGKVKSHTVTGDSGNQITRYFCPTCGCRAHGTNTGRPGILNIPVGLLEDHSWYAPQAVVYTKHRHDWDMTNTDIPNFESMPPSK